MCVPAVSLGTEGGHSYLSVRRLLLILLLPFDRIAFRQGLHIHLSFKIKEYEAFYPNYSLARSVDSSFYLSLLQYHSNAF